MKKILAIVLAALLCVSLFAGCGESKPAAAAETKTEAAAIKIGGIGPLTGGAAIYGTAAKNGAK